MAEEMCEGEQFSVMVVDLGEEAVECEQFSAIFQWKLNLQIPHAKKYRGW